jgi:hypothetical protein
MLYRIVLMITWVNMYAVFRMESHIQHSRFGYHVPKIIWKDEYQTVK